MRRNPVLATFLVLGIATACSKTTPDSQYPPNVGPLPVKPMPTENPFESGSSGEAPSSGSSEQTAGGTPTAISGELPATPPTALVRSHTCKDKDCKFNEFLPDPKLAKSEPGGADSPGTMWLEDVAAGSAVSFPRDHQLELVALVVSGDAVATGEEGGRAHKLEQWGALEARGCGVSIKAGAAGAKIVMGLAAVKGNLGEALATAKAKPFAVRWAKRTSPLASVSLGKEKDLSWGGGAFHARIAFGSETPLPASLEVLMTSASAEIKEHDHPGWEHIAILEGDGTMNVSGTGHPVTSGSVFDIAPTTKHSFSPSGKQPLFAVQMYTPSGPEQRFIKLAGAGAEAAKAAEKPAAKAGKAPAAKAAAKPVAPAPKAPPKPPAKPAAMPAKK